MTLKVKITRDKANGVYTGQLVSLPEVISEGRTLNELRTNIIDALNLVLEVKAELKKAKKSTKISSSNSTVTKKRASTKLYELSV